MANNIFENLTDKEQDKLWMYMIFNKDKIKEKMEQWAKEAEKVGMTLTEYIDVINTMNMCKNSTKLLEERIAEQGLIQGYEWQFKELNKLPPVAPK